MQTTEIKQIMNWEELKPLACVFDPVWLCLL